MSEKQNSYYTVAVQRDFICNHFLVGGDWGPENHKHAHHYKLELQLIAHDLDQHGYLVDIVDIEAALEESVNYYRDKTLNESPGFVGLNPRIEHFSRILCNELANKIQAKNLSRLTVKLWENEIAWASYSRDYR